MQRKVPRRQQQEGAGAETDGLRTLSLWAWGQEIFAEEQSSIHHREQARDSVGISPLLTFLIRTSFPSIGRRVENKQEENYFFESLICLSFLGLTKNQAPDGTTFITCIACTTKEAQTKWLASMKICFFSS